MPNPIEYICRCGMVGHAGDGYFRQLQDASGDPVMMCMDCRGDRSIVGRCDHCSERQLVECLDGQNLCRSCRILPICDNCDDRVTYTQLGLCPSCARPACRDCGGRDDDLDNNGRCTECSGPILDHYDRTHFNTTIGVAPHYFGVELEVECGRRKTEKAKEVEQAIGTLAVLKEDGSLDNGFEIVTKPMCLGSQIKFWNNFFSSAGPRGLTSFTTDTCGLHVHTSRAPLSELTVAKIVCFVNASHNRAFIETIAQRKSCSWAKMYHKKLSDASKRNPERYEAVNLQNVKRERDAKGVMQSVGTIEFRIFKGTLKKESVLKSIQFVAALVEFSKPASRSLKDSVSRVKFITFVHANRKLWPHLSAFISARWEGIETQDTKAWGYKPKDGVVKGADLENDGEV